MSRFHRLHHIFGEFHNSTCWIAYLFATTDGWNILSSTKEKFRLPIYFDMLVSRNFSTKMELQSYLQLVQKTKRKHQCSFCGPKFARMNDKKYRENAVHKNIRQFQCSDCRYSFAKFNLNRLGSSRVYFPRYWWKVSSSLQMHLIRTCEINYFFVTSTQYERSIQKSKFRYFKCTGIKWSAASFNSLLLLFDQREYTYRGSIAIRLMES